MLLVCVSILVWTNKNVEMREKISSLIRNVQKIWKDMSSKTKTVAKKHLLPIYFAGGKDAKHD